MRKELISEIPALRLLVLHSDMSKIPPDRLTTCAASMQRYHRWNRYVVEDSYVIRTFLRKQHYVALDPLPLLISFTQYVNHRAGSYTILPV